MTLFIRRQRNTRSAGTCVLAGGRVCIRADLTYLTANPPVLFIIRLLVQLHP